MTSFIQLLATLIGLSSIVFAFILFYCGSGETNSHFEGKLNNTWVKVKLASGGAVLAFGGFGLVAMALRAIP